MRVYLSCSAPSLLLRPLRLARTAQREELLTLGELPSNPLPRLECNFVL
jgi:hypothetical protein